MDGKEIDPVPIGWVKSPLTDRASAPKQGCEGAPDAWILLEEWAVPGLEGIREGDEILVLSWLDRASRDVLRVRPRGDPSGGERGVFCTRSPDRPNPIGLHPVEVVEIQGGRILVRDLEALDGTPILDIKPARRCSERGVPADNSDSSAR
ncbi:tRNA (N6-threonylcarbamoyladenosine(37)-N6)-methyltransferase TrmO [Rubrobacter naiadicus]|uniref:tRNA (N6-threonylcarbamoyladenosine(37)-N6)-methyltransferase TrmO n=1 Tax=Rubrobacter naiadicus TaxID=1392641 RepID=UPI0023615658|nr:tRNA (N6-threonylcarbamoyladenosine(37)-N6)-methyltransferase TrmO [Rubrobacter naiadicus]